jgi:hypothetical protein
MLAEGPQAQLFCCHVAGRDTALNTAWHLFQPDRSSLAWGKLKGTLLISTEWNLRHSVFPFTKS